VLGDIIKENAIPYVMSSPRRTVALMEGERYFRTRGWCCSSTGPGRHCNVRSGGVRRFVPRRTKESVKDKMSKRGNCFLRRGRRTAARRVPVVLRGGGSPLRERKDTFHAAQKGTRARRSEKKKKMKTNKKDSHLSANWEAIRILVIRAVASSVKGENGE